MLTIRESSWLTENTYSYEEVVRMMAELLGAFRGDIRVSHTAASRQCNVICIYSAMHKMFQKSIL